MYIHLPLTNPFLVTPLLPFWQHSESTPGQDVLAGQYGLPFQWVVAVDWSSVHDIYSFPNTPQAAERGRPVEWGLVLPCSHHVISPGHMLLPLCPEAVPCHLDTSTCPCPALLGKRGALLLVVLLPVGNTADGAMGRAFVGVLVWLFLFVPVCSILGQRPT